MWLLPTLNRIEKLKNFIASAIATDTVTPGWVLVDEVDYEANKAAYDDLVLPNESWELVITKGVTMGEKCREVWPKLPAMSRWVGILNDDHFCVSKNWDMGLIRRLNGKNFVSANDRWVAPMKATTATAWSRPLLDCVGWPIFPPNLQHLFIDDVWEHIGRGSGCWRPCMDVVVEHKHVLNGGGAQDDTHQKVYNQKAWEQDRSTFDLFLKFDLQEVVKKVQDLQGSTPNQRWNPAPSREEKNNEPSEASSN